MPTISGVGTTLPLQSCPHPPANDDMTNSVRRLACGGHTVALLVLGRLLLGAGGIALISVVTILTGCDQ